MTTRRRVWLHRGLAILWWRDSVLFVIMVSLWANASTAWATSEASDDRELAERLDRIEALLRQTIADQAVDGATG